MKLNDIYTWMKKTLNLKKIKSFQYVKELWKTHIDTIKWWLENLNIKQKKSLKVSKTRGYIDDMKSKKYEKINLKHVIKLKNSLKLKLYYLLKSKLPKDKKARVLAYFLLFFSLVYWNKILVENLLISWINNLYKIQYSSNIDSLEIELSKAKTKFGLANFLFLPFNLIPSQKIENVDSFTKILNQTTKIWLDTVDIYKKEKSIIEEKSIYDIYFLKTFSKLKPFFWEKEKEIIKINETLDKINLQEENKYYDYLEDIKLLSKNTVNKLNYLNNNYETFLNIIWKNETKKYFILFQNNDEIRPTGWFIWSAGIVEIFAWRIRDFIQKDIYAFEWDVNKNYNEKVIPPSWISLLSQRLWLRDSNAFTNFEESSKAINYFMQKWFYDIDWVIFINQKIILDILKHTWGIYFWKYDTLINYNNFSEVISLLVEAKVSRKATLDTPKQVLFDFWELLKNKIFYKSSKKTQIAILNSILENIKSRDIVFVSLDKQENDFLKNMSLTWDFKYSDFTNFIHPVFISVWWNKTDRYIKRKYYKDIKIAENKNDNLCSMEVNLDIEIENIFDSEEEEKIKELMKRFRIQENRDLINISWAWDNKSYLKVLIPKYSNVLWSYKIVEEENFKSIERLITTKSWEKNSFNLVYKIENIDCFNHNTKLYKQAWIYEYDIDFNYKNWYKDENLKLNWLKTDFSYSFWNNNFGWN